MSFLLEGTITEFISYWTRSDRKSHLAAPSTSAAGNEPLQQQSSSLAETSDDSIMQLDTQAANGEAAVHTQEPDLLAQPSLIPVPETARPVESAPDTEQAIEYVEETRQSAKLAETEEPVEHSEEPNEVEHPEVNEPEHPEENSEPVKDAEGAERSAQDPVEMETTVEPAQGAEKSVEKRSVKKERPARKEPVQYIFIEELDSPATRREKNRRRKQERQQAEAARAAEEAAARGEQPEASSRTDAQEALPQPTRQELERPILHAPERSGSVSELTSLSELTDVSEEDLTDIGETEIDPEEDVEMVDRERAHALPEVEEEPSMNPEVEMVGDPEAALDQSVVFEDRPAEDTRSSSRRRRTSTPASPTQTRRQPRGLVMSENEPGAIKLREGQTLEGGTLGESFAEWRVCDRLC